MKHLIRTVLLTSCLALVPGYGALANGGKDGNSDPFGKNAKKESAPEDKSSQTTFDQVIDELVSTSHAETERHNQVMSEYDLQRMDLVHDIANSPLADTPLVQQFLAEYDQANTQTARTNAVNRLLARIYSDVHKVQYFNQEATGDALQVAISPDLVDLYRNGVRLFNVEATLDVRQQLRANSSCSGRQYEDLRGGNEEQASSQSYNCYETAQR